MSDYMKKRMQHILDNRPLPEKKKYKLKPVSDKRAAKIAEEKKARGDDQTELQKWYWQCIKLMSGNCYETGKPTQKFPYHEAICCVCHILPKAICKSVATHPCNWIELDRDFHKKFDAMSWEEREKMGCWPEIRDRLVMVWPDLAEDEKRHFPDSVKKWMAENEAF